MAINSTTKPKPVVVERTFDASAERIWRALTHPAEMKKWYFDLPDFRAEVGYRFSFWGGTPEKSYNHLCEVTVAEPLKKLAYSWEYEGFEGSSTVEFSLFETGGKTRLRVTHRGLETFPASNSDFDTKNFKAGWMSILGTSLKGFINIRPI